MSALRVVDCMIKARQVAEYVMHAKGMDVDDADLRGSVIVQVCVALFRLAD